MAPLVLEGETLGEKHQHYNRLVNEALRSKQQLQPIQQSEDDIGNLLKIDVACRDRNVDYILEVLKSEDQLYVSKTIKRSTWLITEPQYAHIINPEHLYTDLYPQMASRTFNKFLLNIRLHLRDEKRVESFYNYIKKWDTKTAYKWLPYCSTSFVVAEIPNYYDKIKSSLLQRLFEKSFSIFETYNRKALYSMHESEFIIKNYPEKLLDFLESFKEFNYKFSPKGTKTLMEKCPERILNKFELYFKCLHLETFAKYLKYSRNIEEFLIEHATNKELTWLYGYDKIQHFINHMPKETRFEFVKKAFIDKQENSEYKWITLRANDESHERSQNTHLYGYYKHAPFDIAYKDLKQLIRAESIPVLRTSMLQVLLSCAGRNMQNVQTVLQYYHDKHINEPFKFKIQFVNFFISKYDTHSLDDRTWDILYQLFHSMEVFIESKNNIQFCIQAIIVRNVIRKELVPDIVKNKFVFDTLKKLKTKLKQEEKDAVFEFLRDFITSKSEPLNLTVEHEFYEAVPLCEHLLNLIKDWGKELCDHSYALDRIKELNKVKKEKHWNRDLSPLYNTKKSWRKAMFQESIAIMPTEKVCVNALKHDPSLLSRNWEQVMAMSCIDNMQLKNLLSKIRIYWPKTLAEDWKSAYIKRLNQPGGHKALVVGLCTLSIQNEINDFLKKYAPSETKINWNEADQLELSLRKQIAKNVHKARPPPSIEGILLYAKGDYMQHVVPSINAVLSQLSPSKSRQHIPLLLDAPVSLQKFGLRCAIRKLPSTELKTTLSEIWNSTKNASIRTVLFTHTLKLLCTGSTSSNINDIWEILSMFIDQLTPDDSKLIFKKLGEIHEVPESIKPQFYMKSYTLLSSLPAKCNCERILKNLQYLATEYMEFFEEDFVINVLLKNMKFTIENYCNETGRLASFILASKDEETQIQRYEKVLNPVLEQVLPEWEKTFEDEYISKQNIINILISLASSFDTYTFQKKNVQIPQKVFESILLKLESNLSYQKDYEMLTIWKLMTAFVKLLNENKHIITNSDKEGGKERFYFETHEYLAPLFIKICVQYLKEDLNRFHPTIYVLFAEAFRKFLQNYLACTMYTTELLLYVKCLLECDNGTETGLVAKNILLSQRQSYGYNDAEKKHFEEIYMIVMQNYSDEIKMHFNHVFGFLPLPVLKSETSLLEAGEQLLTEC